MKYLPHKKFFFSLKWKYTVIISCVVVILYIILSWGIYYKAKSNFEQQLHAQQLEHISVLHDLIDYSSQIMEQFIDSLAQFRSIKKNGNGNSNRQLTDLIEQYWSSLQIIWDLKNITYYHSGTKKISHWGEQKTDLNKLYQIVLQTERPQHLIVCLNQCILYVAVPILMQGQLTGVISIGKSIAETLINFEKITQADIGLWSNEKIPAITNEKNNRPLLQHLFSQYKFYQKASRERAVSDTNIQMTQITFRKQHYFISFSPVNLDNKARFIIINNIEHRYQNLQAERINIIFTGLISLFISLILLLYLLGKALIRIKHFSTALPFLSKTVPDRYQQARKILTEVKSSKYAYDELDQLNTTSLELSKQLEQLENNSIIKNIELKNERDFIHQLIETAPIYIITQTLKGNIISANQQCSNLLKMKTEDIMQSNFEHLFATIGSKHCHLLQNMRQTKTTEIINIDDELITNSGINTYISWLHTLIVKENSAQEDHILSLGIDITERKRAEQQSLWIASHDPLTNLHNRRYFNSEFKKILNIAKRYQRQVALLYLDMDQFKIINDTQGHKAGDQLLVQVANSLSHLSRKSDLLCRLGGDEFALVVPITEIQGVVSLARKINQLIKKPGFNNDNAFYQVGFSIGIAIYPEHGNSIHELLTNADLAMYKAKESGFNQFHIYNPDNKYHQELNNKLEWKQLIEKAIAEQRLRLYYQPILDLKTQTISHYECLLRIVKDNGDIMEPAEFIQFAEELGLIETIDILILNLAIKQQIELQKKNKSHLKLAINLSGRSINNDKVKTEIESILNSPEVCAEKIIFEITETAAVTNFISAQSFINKIRELGCQVALDDFGTGFSSFYYLKNMSFDYIKIDGAFIQRIETDKEDKIFVKALSDVARALGKKTIAEFVESENIINILKELNIDYAQGYHISRPLPDID